MIRATALLYSSHNRCDYLHRAWIVQRALESHDNKTLFYLPFSMGRRDQQEYSASTFEWYFRQFEQYGLKHSTFYYSDGLRQSDVDLFFHRLWHDQVVILGGGNSEMGMERYNALGARFYNDPELFRRILHERQQRGMLTVGFSAGSDQLGEYLQSVGWESLPDPRGFGLARNVLTTLHHETNRRDELDRLSQVFPTCMVFGLPNDSGIALQQGLLGSGLVWQLIEVIIDNSWDLAEDAFHIKTRHGMKVEHHYGDGRTWSFNNGDRVLRLMSPDSQEQKTWIKPENGPVYDYGSQRASRYSSFEEILANH